MRNWSAPHSAFDIPHFFRAGRRRAARRAALLLAAACVSPGMAEPSARPGVHWPQFRGPRAGGVQDGFATATRWDVEKGEDIRWKRVIPGLAHSSPIVWGDRLFVTSAVSDDPEPYLRVGLYGESPKHEENVAHDFRLYCLDKRTGDVLWERTAHRGVPKAQRHIKATQANSTPVTDGRHVVAFFGSEGLYCYDLDGRLVWKKDLGRFDSGPFNAADLQWGFASSPVIHERYLLVQCDARNQAFLAAFDVQTGEELWRTVRDDVPTWSTPTIVTGPTTQVAVNGYRHIGGYALDTGKELWKLRGGGDVPVPTPVAAHDLIFITNAHGGDSPVYAIRPQAEGDITPGDAASGSPFLAWSHPKIGNYMQTPLVYGDELYCCRDSGILACYDARTGSKVYKQRLAAGVGFTASPVGADGKVYFTSETGDVYVIQAGREFRLLATNPLHEICMATPAVSEGVLFFRTRGHVVAIGG